MERQQRVPEESANEIIWNQLFEGEDDWQPRCALLSKPILGKEADINVEGISVKLKNGYRQAARAGCWERHTCISATHTGNWTVLAMGHLHGTTQVDRPTTENGAVVGTASVSMPKVEFDLIAPIHCYTGSPGDVGEWVVNAFWTMCDAGFDVEGHVSMTPYQSPQFLRALDGEIDHVLPWSVRGLAQNQQRLVAAAGESRIKAALCPGALDGEFRGLYGAPHGVVWDAVGGVLASIEQQFISQDDYTGIEV